MTNTNRAAATTRGERAAKHQYTFPFTQRQLADARRVIKADGKLSRAFVAAQPLVRESMLITAARKAEAERRAAAAKLAAAKQRAKRGQLPDGATLLRMDEPIAGTGSTATRVAWGHLPELLPMQATAAQVALAVGWRSVGSGQGADVRLSVPARGDYEAKRVAVARQLVDAAWSTLGGTPSAANAGVRDLIASKLRAAKHGAEGADLVTRINAAVRRETQQRWSK